MESLNTKTTQPFHVHPFISADTNGNFTVVREAVQNLVGFSQSDNANALNCPGISGFIRAWLLSQRYSRRHSRNGRLIVSVTIYANSSRRPFYRNRAFSRDSWQFRARTNFTTCDNVESLFFAA